MIRGGVHFLCVALVVCAEVAAIYDHHVAAFVMMLCALCPAFLLGYLEGREDEWNAQHAPEAKP